MFRPDERDREDFKSDLFPEICSVQPQLSVLLISNPLVPSYSDRNLGVLIDDQLN